MKLISDENLRQQSRAMIVARTRRGLWRCQDGTEYESCREAYDHEETVAANR